ncbi:MAG: glycosyltransferase [Ignavibacteriales bacterium]
MQDKVRVLHIDIDKNWRGGQRQALYLHEYLLSKNYLSIMVCSENSIMEKRCKEQLLRYESINYRNELDLISAVKIGKIVKANKINIIIAHSSHALSLGLLVKLLQRSVKLIAVRRVDFKIQNNILSKWKYKTDYLNKIVCVSNYIKSVMTIAKKIEEKLMTIRDCIDVKRINDSQFDETLKKKLNIQSSEIIIGTVAAFVGHKDYPTFIKAASIVVEKYPNTIFVCVGEGKLKNDMIELSKELNVYEKFRFVGFTDDVISYLKIFDIFVLSSKREGLGSSILDAQAVGLPIIASRTGGIPELIVDGTTGLLVEPKNPKKLSEAILRLIFNKEGRNFLAKNAKENVNEYDIGNYGKNYLELFAELLNE